jgi:hypothetical protein
LPVISDGGTRFPAGVKPVISIPMRHKFPSACEYGGVVLRHRLHRRTSAVTKVRKLPEKKRADFPIAWFTTLKSGFEVKLP